MTLASLIESLGPWLTDVPKPSENQSVQLILETLWPKDELLEVFTPVRPTPEERGRDPFSDLGQTLGESYTLRQVYISNGIWGIPSHEGIQDIIRLANGTPILEIMGGTGYLSYWLKQYGLDVICTDFPPDESVDKWSIKASKHWTQIFRVNASTAITSYPNRTVLVSWIPYGGCQGPFPNDDIKMLEYMERGQRLIVIGETQGGCNASDEFYEYLHKNFYSDGSGNWVQAHGLHDEIFSYQKR